MPNVWLQQVGAEKLENNPSIPEKEEQAVATEGKVIADYEQDIDYEPERSDPEIKLSKHEGEGENSDEKYVKMELPCQETMWERSINHKVAQQILCTLSMRI